MATPLELTLMAIIMMFLIIIVILIGSYLAKTDRCSAAEKKQAECMDAMIRVEDEHSRKWDKANRDMQELRIKYNTIINTQQTTINQLMEKLGKKE